MLTALFATLAAGHGVSAAYVLRRLKRQPKPNPRFWLAASLLFPAGVMVSFWLAKKEA
ncbi:hypothetical protein [Cesiribacter andamanensis]|uniref:Uncharacterized protein n=1 Tax=Cesiribacter andamanensis AMV16 TaxID=1279009 RepID=M7N8I9_9BACT|nr:hypothetical protein [Cesiribacter andamanensis]EMR03531.1 hypothetical protein ADICEAN_01298 [Cesiribacter andamanensis AMV16]